MRKLRAIALALVLAGHLAGCNAIRDARGRAEIRRAVSDDWIYDALRY